MANDGNDVDGVSDSDYAAALRLYALKQKLETKRRRIGNLFEERQRINREMYALRRELTLIDEEIKQVEQDNVAGSYPSGIADASAFPEWDGSDDPSNVDRLGLIETTTTRTAGQLFSLCLPTLRPRHWGIKIDGISGWLEISYFENDGMTIDEVHDRIQQYVLDVNNGIAVDIHTVSLYCKPTMQEIGFLGQGLSHVRHLRLSYGLGNEPVCWSDMEAYETLRSMDLRRSSGLEVLSIDAIHGESFPATIGWLGDNAPPRLERLELPHARFDRQDCCILGKTLSNRDNGISAIPFESCSFSSLQDILIILAGFFRDKAPAANWFRSCKVNDIIVPDLEALEDDNLGFCGLFYRLWLHYAHEDETERLSVTANAFLDILRRFHRAGLQNLLRRENDAVNALAGGGAVPLEVQQQPEPREWFDVLAHPALDDQMDMRFHLLKLNPGVYAHLALDGPSTHQ